MKRAKDTCEKCGRPATQVHHMSYKALTSQDYDQEGRFLVAVCGPCHDMLEQAKKIGLIPKEHGRCHLPLVTTEALKTHRALKRSKTIIDQRIVEGLTITSRNGRMLVAGVLKTKLPDDLEKMIGWETTQTRLSKIIQIIARNPDRLLVNKHTKHNHQAFVKRSSRNKKREQDRLYKPFRDHRWLAKKGKEQERKLQLELQSLQPDMSAIK